MAAISRRRFWWSIAGAAVVLIVGCWLSSGTLAPYGTSPYGPCDYRINGDHKHFRAVFLMLEGKPHASWDYSVVLRRVLHPILAFPLMKAFGFFLGGLLFNVISHVAALVGLAVAIRRYFDARAAILVSWLFATYPGYAYWVGLPYSYAFIVPGCVLCTVALLWWHDRPSLARSVAVACIVGVAGLGYDLIPPFGGALLLLLLFQRRWLDLVASTLAIAAWALFIARGVPAIFGFPALNSNTQVYVSVIDSYLGAWHRTDGWGTLLLDLPRIFWRCFLFSNFLLFPLLAVWLIALRARWRLRPLIPHVALAVLLSELALFLFLNLAPPYGRDDSWDLRGDWIARVFQPWFVGVLILVAATSVALRASRHYNLLRWSVALVVAIDGAVIAGPFLGLTKIYASLNYQFYPLDGHEQNAEWLRKLGRRPYGICP